MPSNPEASRRRAGTFLSAVKATAAAKALQTFFAAWVVTVLLSAAPALALNPIHESSYALLPRGKTADGGTFSVAGILDSRADDFWRIPLSLALEASDRVELGAGIKTQWGQATDDHVPYLVVGGRVRLSGSTALGGDLLLGVDRASGKGFAFLLHHRMGHGSRLYSRLLGRVGFMEALVEDDALMALEGAWYPTLVVARPLSLELGLIASSQTTGFDEHFAFDLQPALQVHLDRESVARAAVALGLAGDRREDMRVEVTVQHGF